MCRGHAFTYKLTITSETNETLRFEIWALVGRCIRHHMISWAIGIWTERPTDLAEKATQQ